MSGDFLQSAEWGEFQKSLGRRVERVNGVQSIFMPLPFGRQYVYCPRGAKTDDVSALAETGKKFGALFVRFEPLSARALDASKNARIVKTVDLQPSHTLLLDVSQTEDRLLAAMHEKTRYNIRLAERKGVVIDLHSAGFDSAWQVFETTGSRGGFRLHPKSYYSAMLKALNGGCRAFLATASFEGAIVAANIMIDYAGTRTYLHGASGNAHRNVMAPFLLHWKLIQDAKQNGLRFYDWWGVAPEGAGEDHPWSGISRFKLGFGGERVDYPGTFDLVLRPGWYQGYAFMRKLMRKS